MKKDDLLYLTAEEIDSYNFSLQITELFADPFSSIPYEYAEKSKETIYYLEEINRLRSERHLHSKYRRISDFFNSFVDEVKANGHPSLKDSHLWKLAFWYFGYFKDNPDAISNHAFFEEIKEKFKSIHELAHVINEPPSEFLKVQKQNYS